MAFTARPLSTDILTQLVFQPGHGFSVGELVHFNGATYALAQADIAANCAGTVMVGIVIDTANFYVVQTGYVVIPGGGFTPGIQYYLSGTVAGTLTSTAPVGLNEVVLPCFVADSATSGFFWGGTGDEIQTSDIFSWKVQLSNTTLAVNKGYFSLTGGTNILTLPATAVIGDTIEIANIGGSFQIAQTGVQYIQYGNIHTSVGALGSLTSNTLGDAIKIVCYQTNDRFLVTSNVGTSLIVA